jgi:hypothetical protein
MECASAGAAAASLFRILAAIAALLIASGQSFIMPDDDPPSVIRVVFVLLDRLASGFVSPVFFAQQLCDALDEQASPEATIVAFRPG